MNTYIIEDWVQTQRNTTLIEADKINFYDGQIYLTIKNEIVACVPNSKFIHKKTQNE